MSLEDRANVYLKYVSGNQTSPDVADGVRMQVYSAEVRNTLKKDINFIPRMKPSGKYKVGPDTLALDFLKVDDGWSVTGNIYGPQTSNKNSLLDTVIDAREDGMVTKQYLTFNSFDEYHILGASEIINGSVTLVDSGGSKLTEGTDYQIKYNSGEIKVLDANNINKDGDGNPDETLNISYRYVSRNDNLAQTMKKMPRRGGNVALEINPTTRTNPSYSVSSVDTSVDRISISGDQTSDFERGDKVVINNSTGNDGEYEVSLANYDSNDNETDLYLGETTMITSFDSGSDVITVTGDLSSISGSIRVVDSNNNNQEFTVSSTSYSSSSDTTDISVSESVSSDNLPGFVIYSSNINDSTSDGNVTNKKGTIHMVHVDTFEAAQRSEEPENVEVSIEAREAIDRV